MPKSSRIQEFWRYFASNRSDLESMKSADDPAYDELLGTLQQIDSGLFIQFCCNPGQNELIITAEGVSDLFPLVEQIVAQAPEMDDWTFFALKPKIGFPNSTCWEDVTVDIGATVVCPVFDTDTGKLGIQFFIRGVTAENREKIHLALLQATDSGLGEKRFAMNVHFSEVYAIEELPTGVTSFPLPELDRYLTWRQGEIAAKRA